MTKITTDFVGGETAEVTKQRFTDILEYWGYDPDGYQTFAEARRDFNELLSGTALGGILGSELASSFKAKINLTNDPAGLLSARLFDDGSAGIFLDASDITTLFQDTAGTTPVTAPGQTVARINDKSGNGFNATQATPDARPTYGIVPETGRRNLLLFSEPSQASETTASVEVSFISGFDGFSSAVQFGDNSIARALYLGPNLLPSTSYTISAFVRMDDNSAPVVGQGGDFRFRVGGATQNTGQFIVESLGGGLYRCSLTATTSTTNLNQTGLIKFTSDSTKGFRVTGIMAEQSSTATPYQRVGTQFDVTEAGVPSLPHLFKLSGNTLNATLPDLGTNATVAYVSDAGVNIMTGQTIGAGSFDVLRDQRLFAMIVSERPFTAAETDLITDYFERIGLKM